MGEASSNSNDRRSSNIELFRCILMLMIITHHFVMNSGIVLFDNMDLTNNVCQELFTNTIIAQMLGWGGKTGIDGFLIITGYYMCKKNISMKKFWKLLSEVIFYNALINGLLLLIGYKTAGKADLIKQMLSLNLINGLKIGSDSFIVHYLLLYLLIPYINACINNISKKNFQKLLYILMVVYVAITTVTLSKINTFSGIGCYMLLYMIGAYIRMYPIKYDSLKYGVVATCISFVVVLASIVSSDYLRFNYGIGGGGYALVDQMNKIGSICCALSLFVLFKNYQIKYNVLINAFASTTLGVLCIHANSEMMRHLIWWDIFKVAKLQFGPVWKFAISIVTVPIFLFAICGMIDLARQGVIKLIKNRVDYLTH